MATITATVDPNRALVRIEVDWTANSGVRHAVARRVVAGVATPVRLSYHQPHPTGPWALLSGGRAIFHDTEAPLDAPITYATDSPDTAATATTAAVTVPGGGVCWFKDPLRPGSNVRLDLVADHAPCAATGGIYLASLGDETYADDTSAFTAQGLSRPLVATNLRKAATSTLAVVTRTLADRDRLAALLAPGSPLLLQTPASFGTPDAYLVVGDVRIARLSADHRRAWRRITCPTTVVDAPVGFAQGVPGTRWTDLCPTYPTWAQVTAAGRTWADLTRGTGVS